MKLVDLTRRLDAADLERIPEAARVAASVLVPSIEPIAPDTAGADIMCAVFQCTREDLPAGEGWGDERLQLSSHLGTHVDAPLHYGSLCEGRPARTIDQIALEELFCDGLVLDVRDGGEAGKGSPSTPSIGPSRRTEPRSAPARRCCCGPDRNAIRSPIPSTTGTRA